MIAKIVFSIFCLVVLIASPIMIIVGNRQDKKEREEVPEDWEVIERP